MCKSLINQWEVIGENLLLTIFCWKVFGSIFWMEIVDGKFCWKLLAEIILGIFFFAFKTNCNLPFTALILHINHT